MSHHVKWVKRPSIRPDDSSAAATLSRTPVSWNTASRIVGRAPRDESTQELPVLEASADGTGELDLDDVFAIELLPGRAPTVSVNATCELQAEDVLAVMDLPEPLPVEPAPASAAPTPWVTDTDDLRVSGPPEAPRRHLGVWFAAASAAACLGVVLAAAAVQAQSSTALVLPRSVHRAAAQLHAAQRTHARASHIPVLSLASLGR